MTQLPVQKVKSWVWLLIGGGILLWIIASCHPTASPPAPTALEQPAYPYDDFGSPKTYVLSAGTEEANLRDGPTISSGVVGQIEPGQELSAIGVTKDGSAGWLVVRTTDGKIAYVKLSLMKAKEADNAAPTNTFTTSFDCTKTKIAAEQMICQDEALAKSDITMSDLYTSVRATLKANARSELTQQQADWIQDRNQCVIEADPKACLSEQYQVRIITLQVTPAKASTDDLDASSSST